MKLGYRGHHKSGSLVRDSSHWEGTMSSIWRSSLSHRVQITYSTDYHNLNSPPQEIIQGLEIPKIFPILKWGLCEGLWEPSKSNNPIRMTSEKSQQTHSCGVDAPLQRAGFCSCITDGQQRAGIS